MRRWEDYKKTMREEKPQFAFARHGDLENLKNVITPENINTQDGKGYSTLMLAAYNGQEETTAWLIAQSADLNQSDNSGNSILMGASFKGHLNIVKMLVAAGAQVDTLNPNNQTALDFAQMFGRTEVVLFLKSKLNKPEVYGLKDIIQGWTSYFFSKKRRAS